MQKSAHTASDDAGTEPFIKNEARLYSKHMPFGTNTHILGFTITIIIKPDFRSGSAVAQW